MPFADLTDVTLFFTDDGVGGVPVVLLHGWGCDSHDWSWQIGELLGEGFRVLAPDLRGHGRSTVPRGGFSAQDCAHDVARLMDELNIPSAIAIGHSFGAFVASALAVEHPALVRAVVVVDPGYGRDDSLADVASRLRAALRASRDGSPAGEVFEGMEGTTTSAGLRAWHRRRVIGTPRDALLKTLDSLFWDPQEFASRHRADVYLRRRTCPVLAIHTVSTQAAWEETTFQHPASRTVTWSGTGHWLHQERASEFNAVLLDWMRGLPKIGTAESK